MTQQSFLRDPRALGLAGGAGCVENHTEAVWPDVCRIEFVTGARQIFDAHQANRAASDCNCLAHQRLTGLIHDRQIALRMAQAKHQISHRGEDGRRHNGGSRINGAQPGGREVELVGGGEKYPLLILQAVFTQAVGAASHLAQELAVGRRMPSFRGPIDKGQLIRMSAGGVFDQCREGIHAILCVCRMTGHP